MSEDWRGLWESVDKASKAENELLEAPFSENEIKEAIFGSYAEEAPSQMG